MRAFSKILFFALLLLFWGVSQSLAADFSLSLGETILANLSGSDTVRIRTDNNKSYCCSVQNRDASVGMNWIAVGNLSSNGAASLASRAADGAALSTSALTARYCHFQDDLVAPTAIVYTLAVGGGSGIGSVRCEETTLVGGFNTSVTDFNFLEISAQAKSTSTVVVSGRVIINTVVNPQTIEIPFAIDFSGSTKQRQDISIHDAIGNTKDFGQVTLIHNGANGMVRARISQYRIVTLSPLDFEPVLQEVMTPRTEGYEQR